MAKFFSLSAQANANCCYIADEALRTNEEGGLWEETRGERRKKSLLARSFRFRNRWNKCFSRSENTGIVLALRMPKYAQNKIGSRNAQANYSFQSLTCKLITHSEGVA